MPRYNVKVSCPIHDSFRVQQVAGMFDVPLHAKATEQFAVHLPTDRDDWQIGLIVGPSGSGKSTVAKHAFGDTLYPMETQDTGDREQGTGKAVEVESLSPVSRILPPPHWPTDRAVIDAFGDLPVRNVVELFTAVGFGSPPSWVKPYHVLSNGEKFRCDLAKALAQGFLRAGASPPPISTLDPGVEDDPARSLMNHEPSLSPCLPHSLSASPLVVFDEFTSVVDRTVAKVCSAAIAKGIRNGHIPCRFVAVTCHYDVADWLEPDWVLDMATRELRIRPLEDMERSGFGVQGSGALPEPRTLNPEPWFRRPPIELAIHRCRLATWEMFKRHHYLSGILPPGSRTYLTTWNDTPVNFCATLPVIAKRNHRRFTRIVTLPDYQGLGIGMRSVAAVAELHRAEGHRINVTSSHPALIRHCVRSPLWKAVNVKKTGTSPGASKSFPNYHSSAGRAVVSFEFVGP